MFRAVPIVILLFAFAGLAWPGSEMNHPLRAPRSAKVGQTAAPGKWAPAVVQVTGSPVAVTAPEFPPVDPSSGFLGLVFEQTRTVATAQPPIVIDQAGTLVQIPNQYSIGLPSPEVMPADFYTIFTFVNPTDLSVPVDVGIGFRAALGTDIAWQVMLRSNSRWYLLHPGPQPIASGSAPSFDPAPGASNTIELIVQAENGFVAVNGVVLAQLDLSMIQEPGSVYLGTGFIREDIEVDREVSYHDWYIYPLGRTSG